PVCETEYTENEVETCAVCGYDLTPLYFLDKVPEGFLEKERKRIAAAKRVWQQSQCQLQSAQAIVSQLQSQLYEMMRKIDGLTESHNQHQADFKTQLYGIEQQNQQQLMNLQLQLDEMNRQIRNLTQSPPPEGDTKKRDTSDRDYTQLKKFLKSGNWKDADQETARIMWAVAGQTNREYLDTNDIKKFRCEDLRIINHLWVKYSDGRFGFSVQKQIYINCGGKPNGRYDSAIWNRFGEEVGWRVNGKWLSWSDCTFSPSASRGHLPCAGGVVGGGWVGRGYWVGILSRAQTCNL
ncbi:GUN4 domain-containing protein, partial [Lyngbya sp. CCY1209]|uniref:GUN4 domain-containing protein n=1 Tax=Lyngbya sp. CCY1209 TaxID=2886103 RepID=UPI002D208FF8